MSVHKISSTNIEKYRKLLPKTACENVLRACYRGVVSEGEKGISIIIWEMVNEPKTGEKRADVRYIVNEDIYAFDDVFNYYLDFAEERSLTVTFEIMGSVSKDTAKYLKEKGFPVEKAKVRMV